MYSPPLIFSAHFDLISRIYFSENQGKSPGLLDHSSSEQIGPFQSITSQRGFLPKNESCMLPADETSSPRGYHRPQVPAMLPCVVQHVGAIHKSQELEDT